MMATTDTENDTCPRCVNSENSTYSYVESCLEQLKVTFAQVNIDIEAPCTQTAEMDCWVLSNLTPWNKFLHLAGMELKEVEPGKLAIAALNLDVCGCCDEKFLHDAFFLIYLLITNHRCIQFFRPHPVLIERSGSAFKKALASNASLCHFEYRGSCKFRHDDTHFAEGVSALGSVEDLHLTNITLSHSSAVLLAGMIEKNQRLKRLTFSHNSLSLHSSEVLLRALKTSPSLEALAFDNNSLGRKAMRYLGQLVAGSRSLKKLSLMWSIKAGQGGIDILASALKVNGSLSELDLYGCDNCTEVIAEALKDHSSLKVVTLTCCAVSNSDAEKLARMLESNSTLQVLDVASNNIGDPGAEALAAGLCKNDTLWKLCLLENRLSAQGIKHLCTALARNGRLRIVEVGSVFMLPHESEILSGVLRQAGAYGRVRLSWQDVDLPELAVVLRGNTRVEEIQLDCTALSLCSLQALFCALCTNGSVTKLHLRGQLQRGAMEQLIKVINHNKSIKYLNFDCQGSEHVLVKDFIEALSHNGSIISCDIYIHEYTPKLVKALSALVRENKSLTSLVIHSFPSHYIETLSKALCNNHVLTRLELGYAGRPNRSTFRIGEALRRNCTLLKQAAQFALHPSIDKTKAEVFEKLEGSKSLLRFLAQQTKKDELSARKLLRMSRSYIALNFFKIVGIVKESLQCEEGGSEKVQIDHLNEGCWLTLLLYVRLSDVFKV